MLIIEHIFNLHPLYSGTFPHKQSNIPTATSMKIVKYLIVLLNQPFSLPYEQLATFLSYQYVFSTGHSWTSKVHFSFLARDLPHSISLFLVSKTFLNVSMPVKSSKLLHHVTFCEGLWSYPFLSLPMHSSFLLEGHIFPLSSPIFYPIPPIERKIGTQCYGAA